MDSSGHLQESGACLDLGSPCKTKPPRFNKEKSHLIFKIMLGGERLCVTCLMVSVMENSQNNVDEVYGDFCKMVNSEIKRVTV